VTSAQASWSDSGVEEVVPGVWRLPLPLPNDGLRAVNVYAVRDDNGLTFIDGGWALDEARRELVKGLSQIGAELGDIQRFLVTHIHRDHYSNAVAIRREFGTSVLLGIGERPAVELIRAAPGSWARRQTERLDRLGAADLAQWMRDAHARDGVNSERLEEPDEWITAGQRFAVGDRVLEAIPTPGHTTGHVVFADRAAGVLFAGDHVLPHITPSIGFEANPGGLPLQEFLNSLRLVRSMPDMLLLPAHGPAGGRSHARVDELLAHHATRLDLIAQALDAGWTTAYQVAGQIGWTRRSRALVDLDPFNQMLAVFETALHLDLLVAQNRAVAKEAGGVVEYGPMAGGSAT
jgi:glyoxylase-like metal-dependent hydrolase (beta-lactamase superfamily II)